MKTKDILFSFPGNHRTGYCRVRLFKSSDGGQVAILTSLTDWLPTVSVTNAVEDIREELIKQRFIRSSTTIIEHYERSQSGMAESFDVVTFPGPHWRTIDGREVQRLVNSDFDELTRSTISDPEYHAEISQIREESDLPPLRITR